MKHVFALVALLAAVLRPAAALSLTIGPKKTECFDEVLPRKGVYVLTGSYSAVQSTMDVTLKNERGSSLWSSHNRAGNFNLPNMASGRYQLCFTNPEPISQRVGFALHYRSEAVAALAGQEHVDMLEEQLEGLMDQVELLHERQMYLKERERVHHDTTVRINSRVFWFAMVEAAVVVGIGVWQLYKLRSLFEVRRRA
eukprot:PLAT4792.1.p2 GENE.PLAT4792.1~~PLAT4792.1.p2  ORF type:complete len:197 (-),score=90.57 PLAT4792.1:110-700(-)